MSGNLRERILLIVSDTAMYEANGETYIYEPVLREVDALAAKFDKIIWIGAKPATLRKTCVLLQSQKIKPVILPCLSKPGGFNMLNVLAQYPNILFKVFKYLSVATHIHTRGPSHPALLGVLMSYLDKKRTYVHKYAGSWSKEKLPFTYSLQRSLLKNINKKKAWVTVNSGQRCTNKNIINLPNPCLSVEECEAGAVVARNKDYNGKLKLLFVGTLMRSKGVLELIDAVKNPSLNNRFDDLKIVGDGTLKSQIEQQLSNKKFDKIKVSYVGSLDRAQLNEEYAKSHIIILPSISEGLPKVIIEAMSYGCIPVVTKIEALQNYLNTDNSFSLNSADSNDISHVLNSIPKNEILKKMSLRVLEVTSDFTYKKYLQKVSNLYGFE